MLVGELVTLVIYQLSSIKENAMPLPSFAIPEALPFDQLLSLKGRRAIVTGGSRGIGEAIVLT